MMIMRWCNVETNVYDLQQSGRSPKLVALFSATNFSSYFMELRQLHDTIQNIHLEKGLIRCDTKRAI